MNNQELFLARIFGQANVICYPHVWRKKDGESNKKENEILVDGTKHVVQRIDLGREIQEILDTFGKKPKQILNLRFGLKDGKRRTYREIGREYGVSVAYVGQIIHRFLYRLRHLPRSQRLKDFIIPSPEERFKEKQRFLNLEAELKRKTESPSDDREDEKRLDMVLKHASDDYQ